MRSVVQIVMPFIFLEFIAYEWKTFLVKNQRFSTVKWVVLKHFSMAENLKYVATSTCTLMTIVLLNCDNLNMLLQGRSVNNSLFCVRLHQNVS